METVAAGVVAGQLAEAEPLSLAETREVLRRIAARLIPFMFLLYVLAYLDRVNVGMAKLQMQSQLGLSDAVYGFGAGIFFWGYFLLEIPSNLILERIGARIWITRIMVTWGIIAAAQMFTRDPITFYSLRFLLGAAEAGFFPGMILYLTYWFPAAERARAVALFMTASALALMIGSPISGALLGMHSWGLQGWQWLFLLEGIPSCLFGVVTYFYLPDRPHQVPWLTTRERAWLIGRLEREQAHSASGGHDALLPALVEPKAWLLCAVYFGFATASYGFSLWLPDTVKKTHGLAGVVETLRGIPFLSGSGNLDNFAVGLLTAIPYAAAAIGMVLIGMNSDRTGERRWHASITALAGAGGLALAAFAHNMPLSILGFSLGAIGLWGVLGPFWSLPTAFLSGTAAAGGIALINSVGNLGGFFGPFTIGWLKDHNALLASKLVAAIALGIAGILVLLVRVRAHLPSDHQEAS